jgi:hypothetical protein
LAITPPKRSKAEACEQYQSRGAVCTFAAAAAAVISAGSSDSRRPALFEIRGDRKFKVSHNETFGDVL